MSYPPTLTAHLAREVTTVCHCWRLTRKDGVVTGYTDHDRPLTIGAVLYAPQTGLAASEARDTLGLAVDTVDVEGALSSDDISDEDIAAGLYDGATVETLLVNWRQPDDFVLLRKATVGKITRTRRAVCRRAGKPGAFARPAEWALCEPHLRRGTGRSALRLRPRQSGFHRHGTVAAHEAPATLVGDRARRFDAGWFAHGVLTWTAGANAGRTERVEEHRKDATGTTLVLRPGSGIVAADGDTFTVVAGCDKKFATCKAKFANALNFRGFPHLPGNDAAYGYVVDGGQFDGGPIVP